MIEFQELYFRRLYFDTSKHTSVFNDRACKRQVVKSSVSFLFSPSVVEDGMWELLHKCRGTCRDKTTVSSHISPKTRNNTQSTALQCFRHVNIKGDGCLSTPPLPTHNHCLLLLLNLLVHGFRAVHGIFLCPPHTYSLS